MTSELAAVAEWLRSARSVAALTGAGISTESGIPDFRGPDGVWTKNPAAEKLATLHYYMAEREVRVLSWQGRLAFEAWTAEPNEGHLALARLESKGRLQAVITQNIDGLHQRAGSSPESIVEIHGTVHEIVCMSCRLREPIQPTLDRVRAGEEDPPCLVCGGILKTATISFGESLVPSDVMRAEEAAASCDVFLAIGTSLTVYPAADLPRVALSNGARLVIINAEQTPYDSLADCVLREKIGEVLPALVDLV